MEEGGAFSDVLLAHRLDRIALSPADQGLVARLVYGVLTWQGYLDWWMGQVGRPADALDPAVRRCVRLGLFQLRFLDRVPDYAAVNTTVELAKRYRGGAAAGLVNALLRRAAAGPAVSLPPRESDLATHLSVRWSHPRWLVERWLATLGARETEDLLAANCTPAPTVLRVHGTSRDNVLDELRSAGITARPTRYSPWGIELEPGTPLRRLGTHLRSRVRTQGEASQLVPPLLAPSPGQRLLDACAAPGGKAIQLSALVGKEGLVVALDRRLRGLKTLREGATALGANRLVAVAGDGTRPPLRMASQFDGVLVDAPCSGLGTLRAHPELRWRRLPEDIPRLARLQRALLDGTAPLVRPGGRLLYATCTLLEEENEGVIEAFLRERHDFALLPAPREAPYRHFVNGRGLFRAFPHRHGTEGFFAAVLVRH